MSILLTIVFGLLILGILVFVHELGHFIAAKSCKIRVLTFSLGFGNALIKRQVGETEYRISTIPFGGYVRMAGEDPEKKQGAMDEYSSKPIYQRAIVAAAGPFSNVLFALLFLWIAYMYGIEMPQYMNDTTIGAVLPNTSASAAGFQPGDSIIAIDGQPITSWEEIQQFLLRRNELYQITFLRRNQKKSITFSIQFEKGEVTGGLVPPIPAQIGNVEQNSPAAEAGLEKGDLVLFINGDTIYSAIQLTNMIESWNQGDKPLQITVNRQDSVFSTSAVPRYSDELQKPVLGVAVAVPPSETVSYSPIEAFQKSLNQAWEFATLIFRVLGMLFTGRASTGELAGPVGIIQVSGQIAQQSLSAVLIFMALLGINLALINLLPLVITDGGVLLFLLIEAVRGKPLSEKTQSLINRIAILFFLALFLFLTFNDVLRIAK